MLALCGGSQLCQRGGKRDANRRLVTIGLKNSFIAVSTFQEAV
jgi:hypothetical protein